MRLLSVWASFRYVLNNSSNSVFAVCLKNLLKAVGHVVRRQGLIAHDEVRCSRAR